MTTHTFISLDTLEELRIAEAEHHADREFECLTGNCDTCDEFSFAIDRMDRELTRIDCDGCGRDVALRTPPRQLVIVLCASCNHGTAIC